MRHKLIERKVSKDKLDALGRALARFEVLAFTNSAALCAARVLSDLKRLHVKIGYADMLQAGHAIALGRTMVTDDADFSRVPGLAVENWRRSGPRAT